VRSIVVDHLHPLKPRRTGALIKTLEKANSYQFNSPTSLTMRVFSSFSDEKNKIRERGGFNLRSIALFYRIAIGERFWVCENGPLQDLVMSSLTMIDGNFSWILRKKWVTGGNQHKISRRRVGNVWINFMFYAPNSNS